VTENFIGTKVEGKF